MTISTTKLVDNDFHIIVNSNGIGSGEDQTLVDVVNSNNASSEPKVSIANIVYEIQGTGNRTVFVKNETEKNVVLSVPGNYCFKPIEEKLKDTIGDILLSSDSNVTKYNVVIQTHKESGYN